MKNILLCVFLLMGTASKAQTYAWLETDNKFELVCFIAPSDDTIAIIDDIHHWRFFSDSIIFKVLGPSYNAGDEDYFVTTDATGQLLRTPKTSVPQFFQPGFITAYGGSSAPTGYFLCDGTAVSRSTYSALFSIIGTTYGVGNGSTTFNIPDLQQRFPIGKATAGTGSTLGGTGGTIDHLHTVDPPNTTTNQGAVINNVTLLAIGSAASPTHTHDVNIAEFNSGTANPPYLVINYIIKY